jgi:uncharacterized protein (TIGR02099 family)
MKSLRKIFRRLRTLLWTALTLLTVLAAVMVGFGKLLMPYSDYYQPKLEGWLTKAFNQPVSVESFNGEWKAFGPRISLQGVTFSSDDKQPEIAIQHAALDIKPLNALIPGRPLYSFRIIGADLSLQRTDDGRYVLSGLGVSNTGSGRNSNPQLRNVALNGEVRLEESSLTFDDPEREIHLVLSDVNGRLKMDGQQLAVEIQARVSDQDRRRVVGDLEATMQVELDKEQHLANARWHIKTGELMLAELVRQLPHHPLLPVSGWLNAELWGSWQQGSPQEMQGVLDLRDAQLTSQSGPLIIDHLNSRFNWAFSHPRDWRIDLSNLVVSQDGVDWQSERLSVARNLPDDLGLWISSDFIRLNFPLQLTQRIMASYNTEWPAVIPQRAQGSVSDFDLLLDSKWHLKKVEGQLENGHFWGWGKGPEIAGLNAQFALESNGGDISLRGQDVRLDWPRVFRRQLLVEMTDCSVEILLGDLNTWQMDMNHCRLQNDDISVFGRVRAASGEGKPEVDINVAMDRGDISRFGDYWPENVMTDKTVHWLRTSLLSGMVKNGRFSMIGDLDDFPFKNNRGRMQGYAPVKDAELKYADNWPHARQIDAVAMFEASGMLVKGRIGDTGGTRVDRVTARIPDFKQPVLDVEYQTSTDLSKLTTYIRRTPLLDGLALDPEQFVLTGDSEISGKLHTPLGKGAEQLRVTGALQLKGTQFTDRVSDIKLDTMTGIVNYDREGLNATQIDAGFRGYTAKLDVMADWDADEVFRATLHGDLPADLVIPVDLARREPLFDRAIGISPWVISLSIAAVDGREERDIWLEVASGLEGTVIDLPAPLNKSVEASWPLLVRYPMRAESLILTADLAGRAQLRMELAEGDARPIRAAIGLGGEAGDLPQEGQFVVTGSTPLFDLEGWLDVVVDKFSKEDEGGGLVLQSASLDAGQVRIFDRLFEDVGIKMQYEDTVVTGEFDCPDLNGKIRYYQNDAGSHSLTGEFERLIMPDPVSGGVTMVTNPSELPELRFYSKEFSYLGLDLGETRIEGYPVKNGFHLDSVEAKSPDLELSASGDWIRDGQGERSDFNIRITSESLGTVLEAMDVSSAMQGGQTVVHFDAWWNGPPAAFALERLNGEMELNIVQGNILTADPGAGRVLGLLSLTELPRRLAMDFRDVFDEGFSFDEATGTMQLENGSSYTDDLLLKSTVAEINIVGTTDLVGQTFDYEFSVRPGVSKALPVIGAIAGGPVGAAAGLALQAVLRNSLGEAAEAKYTIRGPWEDPVVEPVKKLPGAKTRPENNANQEETSDKQPTIDDQPTTDVQQSTDKTLTGDNGND